MSSEGGHTSKTLTAGSQTWGSCSAKGGALLQRRRTRIASEKKIADDEFMAAAIGDVEWLKQSLRDIGGQINYDKNGLTAIHLAAIHGRLECLKLCIEKFKIDVNLASTTGWRPVHLTISNQTGKRSLQCLTYLLEKGGDPSVDNDDGITPVHQAASEGHVQCLKYLIEHGAKVDERDCRGNTPLDLAKLWGHRKCARILAAETWHQDKDHVAKEMNQLKKLRMQQVLRELEEEEEFKAEQEFYGEQAFQQWLHQRKLDERPVGPQGLGDTHEGLYRPNSKQPKRSSETLKMKVEVAHRTPSPLSKRGDTYTSMFTDELLDGADLYETEDKGDNQTEEIRQISISPPHTNPNPWIKSTKVAEKDYLPNLKDVYPRDEYTMMPLVKSAPTYYDGKFGQTISVSEVETENALIKKKLRKPDLPEEEIEKLLKKDPSLYDRPIVFKTRHIYDIPTKRKYQKEVPKNETPLHLSDDLRSHMVRNCLIVPTGLSTPSNSSSSASDWMTEHFPRAMVLNTLKQMSKPSHFLSSEGKEYELNFGDLKSI